jgi:hypothetical protein
METDMLCARFRPISSVLAAVILLTPSSFAFDTSLSDHAVREAYFLGQRRDEKTAEFLEKYRQHLSVPESGPWVSTVELFTPYAEAVELSRQRSSGYSAQDAAQDYRKNGDRIRVTITIQFTDTYGAVIQEKTKTRSGSPNAFSLRTPDFWKDFSFRLFDGDEVVEPLEVQGNSTYLRGSDSSDMTGAVIVLLYDAQKIDPSSDAAVVVDIPDHQQVVAPFDLATLR